MTKQGYILDAKGRIQVFPRQFRAIFEFSYWSGARVVTSPSRSRNNVTSCLSWYFFWSIKILLKKTCWGQPRTGPHPWLKSINVLLNQGHCCRLAVRAYGIGIEAQKGSGLPFDCNFSELPEMAYPSKGKLGKNLIKYYVVAVRSCPFDNCRLLSVLYCAWNLRFRSNVHSSGISAHITLLSCFKSARNQLGAWAAMMSLKNVSRLAFVFSVFSAIKNRKRTGKSSKAIQSLELQPEPMSHAHTCDLVKAPGPTPSDSKQWRSDIHVKIIWNSVSYSAWDHHWLNLNLKESSNKSTCVIQLTGQVWHKMAMGQYKVSAPCRIWTNVARDTATWLTTKP